MQQQDDRSPIQQFFSGKSVLITGGTGFMGKVLTEKLLRSCPDLGQIVLLVRPKKEKGIHQRVDDIFDDPVSCKLEVMNIFYERKLY